MADRSFVATRSRHASGPAFPDRPTHPVGAACDGFAIVTPGAIDLTMLRVLRDDITGIWQGELGDVADRATLLVVMFVGRRPFDLFPSALPLLVRDRTLMSYTALRRFGQIPASPPPAPQRVDLWWGGRAHDLALGNMTAISLAALWDLPTVKLHHSTAGAVRRGPGTMERNIAGPAERRARVSHAKVRMADGGIAAFDSTDAALKALHDRTKLGAIFNQALARLLGGRSVGAGGGDAAGNGEGAAREPGVMENLAGWVRWHTPLGKGLVSAFGNRLQIVEKLLQAGDIDSALKLALKLGKGDGSAKRNHYPARLPDMRARLDFSIGASGTFSMPILGGTTFDTIRQRYLALAGTLERQGDYRRAAYIQAQLLGEHRAAVLTLEKGALYHDAAKLALDAKLPPALYIRLFYKAGERDTALALARRSGCFDALAEDSRAGDADYHAYVVNAWTDMLVASGQHVRALQVTDALAAANRVLIGERREWLRCALDAAGRDTLTIELLVRTILTAHWTADDIAPDGFDQFPVLETTGASPYAAVLDRVQALMLQRDAHHAGDLVEFLSMMARMADARALEQAAFWQGPGPIVMETFARSLLEAASAGLAQRDLATLGALLKQAKLEVLATDLAKLRNLHAAPATSRGDWHLPSHVARASVVRHACLLHNGNVVLWRENGLLQLLDRHGAALWQGNVGDVTALIAMGSGPNVIIVQQLEDSASRRLTRFASHQRCFHDIGAIDLVAHHDVTSEGQWMVQVGGEIGALDLAKLCADPPTVEFSWSAALTGQVEAIGFLHVPGEPRWITRARQSGRDHLLEMWIFRDTRELHARLGRPAVGGKDRTFIPPSDWVWSPGQADLQDAAGGPAKLPFVDWSVEAEREIVGLMAMRHRETTVSDTIQSRDFDRAHVVIAQPGVPGVLLETIVSRPGKPGTRIRVRHAADEPLMCLARGTRLDPGGNGDAGDRSQLVLLADSQGRVLRIDLATQSVLIW